MCKILDLKSWQSSCISNSLKVPINRSFNFNQCVRVCAREKPGWLQARQPKQGDVLQVAPITAHTAGYFSGSDHRKEKSEKNAPPVAGCSIAPKPLPFQENCHLKDKLYSQTI